MTYSIQHFMPRGFLADVQQGVGEMPKAVEYPRRSLSDALKLAETVSSLGGKCSVETCAESMKKKVSGAFAALVSAAVKYGLVTSKSGQLAVTEQFNRYRLAYDEEEKRQLFRQAFLSVPLFSQVFTRFRDGKLPGDILTKVLIREFDVNENRASAVRQYFIEGAIESGLLTEDGKFVESNAAERDVEQTSDHDEADHQEEHAPQPIATSVAAASEFSITVTGPGLDSTLAIREPEDLLIVDAILQKVKRKLEVVGDGASSTPSDSLGDQVQAEASYEE